MNPLRPSPVSRTHSPAHLLPGLLFAVLFAVTGCGGAGGRGASGNGSNDTTQTASGQVQTGAASSLPARPPPSHGERLQLPSIPATLNAPEQQAEYLVMHYWDNYDFSDTTLIRNADYTEQAFVDFIYLLPNMPQTTVRKAISTLIGRTAINQTMFDHFTKLAESYLYDPNSPLRSEELYLPVLEAVIALPELTDIHKIRPRHQLAMALKNRPGTVATDFWYTTERPVSGSQRHTATSAGKATAAQARIRTTGRLWGMKGDFTLLFFYDPDCPDCKRVKQYIAASSLFGELTAANRESVGKRLSVLAIYPDSNLDAWRKHLSEMPQGWTVGYDKGQVLHNEELYDLKAIPTLYLLDRDKRVLLKDATVESIEAWLNDILCMQIL